ncbi:MAG: hypothetical protein U9O78_01110 [Patescibacteria group bacterium]|nr:hypothetical protein [Patescibacteria group bacterium]
MKKILYIAETTDNNLPQLFFEKFQKHCLFKFIILNDDSLDLTKLDQKYDLIFLRNAYRPHLFKKKIQTIIKKLSTNDSPIIDGVESWENYVQHLDKWYHYQILGEEFFPFSTKSRLVAFKQIDQYVAKKPRSSRSKGVYIDLDNKKVYKGCMFQKKIDIDKEMRIIYCNDQVLEKGVYKRSKKTDQTRVKVQEAFSLDEKLIRYTQAIMSKYKKSLNFSSKNLFGLDIALDKKGDLFLIEINRSPIVQTYYDKTKINVFEKLFI